MTPGEIVRRLRDWARRGTLERELSAELEDHLALMARDLEHAGLSSADAQAAARRQLGNPTRILEASRESWGFHAIEVLRMDFRHAVRALRHAPGFTAAVILTLGLGVGATTAIFSVVNGVLLHPLPFPNEGRLVTLCEEYPGKSRTSCSASPPNIADIAARSQSLEAIGIGREWGLSHLSTPDGAQPVRSGIATPGMFAALGADVVRGRPLTDADLLGRDSDVALLTWEMWQTRFGGDPGIVERTIRLDDQPVRIVGILAPGFQSPRAEAVELWRPVHVDPRDEQHRHWRGFVVYGRLKPGVSLARAQAELGPMAAVLRSEHFSTTRGWGVTMQSLRTLVVGNVRPQLLLFLAAVSLVLLIACANVSNLMLVRGAVRAREMAARAALGAGRGRIALSLLMESLILAGGGAVIGISLALGAVRAFRALAPEGIPRVAKVTVDARVLAFAVGLAILSALLVSLVPAVRAARVDLAQALREGGRAAPARATRMGPTLVVIELAVAVVLVAGAGALTRSFAAFSAWNPGFERDHLLVVSLSPPARYDSTPKLAALWDRLEGELGAIPGVERVGTASAGPLVGGREVWEMELQGYPPDEKASVRWHDVSPSWFQTLGVPLRKGRDLTAEDVQGGLQVCLVNEALVRRYWPDVDPIGRTIVFPAGGDRRLLFTVVGVVGDVPSILPGTPAEPEMYWSNRQLPRPFTNVVLRTTVPPHTIEAALRQRVREVDRDITMGTAQPMSELIHRELAAPRFSMILLQCFSLVALALAAVGTYGLLAYLVTLRRREIGIRLALGAPRRRVVSEVIRGGLSVAAVGIAGGIAGFLLLGRFIAALAPGITLDDPSALAETALGLVLVTIIACSVPALRAGRVNPAITLSAE